MMRAAGRPERDRQAGWRPQTERREHQPDDPADQSKCAMAIDPEIRVWERGRSLDRSQLDLTLRREREKMSGALEDHHDAASRSRDRPGSAEDRRRNIRSWSSAPR
jgi:hypothetical protein